MTPVLFFSFAGLPPLAIYIDQGLQLNAKLNTTTCIYCLTSWQAGDTGGFIHHNRQQTYEVLDISSPLLNSQVDNNSATY